MNHLTADSASTGSEWDLRFTTHQEHADVGATVRCLDNKEPGDFVIIHLSFCYQDSVGPF